MFSGPPPEARTVRAMGDLAPPSTDTRIGYARSAVDSFRAAADAERARLLEVLDDARRRLERAQAADHTQRLMLEMLMDAERELGAARRAAEAEAARIVAAAQATAGRASADARENQVPEPLFVDAIDLAAAEQVDASTNGAHDHHEPTRRVRAADFDGDGGESDEYFRYLRGALVDDAPLGPVDGRAGR